MLFCGVVMFPEEIFVIVAVVGVVVVVEVVVARRQLLQRTCERSTTCVTSALSQRDFEVTSAFLHDYVKYASPQCDRSVTSALLR